MTAAGPFESISEVSYRAKMRSMEDKAMPSPSIIAIDGPGASGKSSVGRIIAEKLGYTFIDTGKLYRAITWLALRGGITIDDEAAVIKLATEAEIEPSSDGASTSYRVRGRSINAEIAGAEVDACVSQIAQVAGVRRVLAAKQRELARGGRIVMAGRDIGTVVLPEADLKVFLNASLEERARRRFLEERPIRPPSYEDILSDLRLRDDTDSRRSLSPLQPASDAVVIDTEGLSPELVAEEIMKLAGRI